ncbi:hypothetical protein DY000_02046463 [Brassica cretica]|uniref:Uncharacterized protein n=1 Tax=Brassica cretica TaxID=69181 RepID=A0ABQ7F297_BRACR|nr:hypothetical protein DY000_02046463 [Brassica cretica]
MFGVEVGVAAGVGLRLALAHGNVESPKPSQISTGFDLIIFDFTKSKPSQDFILSWAQIWPIGKPDTPSPCLFVFFEKVKEPVSHLSLISSLGPSPLIRIRSRREGSSVASPRNHRSMNEDLVSSTAMASHLLLSILPSKSLRRAVTYFTDDGSPHRLELTRGFFSFACRLRWLAALSLDAIENLTCRPLIQLPELLSYYHVPLVHWLVGVCDWLLKPFRTQMLGSDSS